MSHVWMTHPELTPGHDVKVARGGVAAKLSSGWQVREDQADPAPVDVPADPRPARPAPPAAGVPVDPQPPTEAAPQTPATSGLSKPSPLSRDLKES